MLERLSPIRPVRDVDAALAWQTIRDRHGANVDVHVVAESGEEVVVIVSEPRGARLPFELVRVHGDLAYVSGHGPFDGDRQLYAGRVGARSRAGGRPVRPRTVRGPGEVRRHARRPG